jgi:hypothetical protein
LFSRKLGLLIGALKSLKWESFPGESFKTMGKLS